jgi:hypothetical protein
MKSDIENVVGNYVWFMPAIYRAALYEYHVTHNRLIIQLFVIWKIGV